MKKDDFWQTMVNIDDLLEDRKGVPRNIKNLNDFCQYTKNNNDLTIDARVSFLTNRDKAYCILFGTFGAFTAASISESFAQIHDKEYSKKDNPILSRIAKILDHPGTYPDKIKGGCFHRPEFGHDILNLKEVFECIEEDGKGDLWKGSWDYFKHVILADPLSKQGIPMPGSSSFRDTVVEIAKTDQDFYKSVLTYKHKDLVGYLLVEGLVKFYNYYYGIKIDMYRFHEMHFYSQLVNLVMSFSLFTPATVNWPSFFRMTKSFYDICKLSQQLNDEWIKNADEIINKYR